MKGIDTGACVVHSKLKLDCYLSTSGIYKGLQTVRPPD